MLWHTQEQHLLFRCLKALVEPLNLLVTSPHNRLDFIAHLYKNALVSKHVTHSQTMQLHAISWSSFSKQKAHWQP